MGYIDDYYLCTPHISKHRFNYKDQRGFPMPRKEGHLIGGWVKINKNNTEEAFEHGEVINYALDGV